MSAPTGSVNGPQTVDRTVLADLDEDARYARFDRLQRGMRGVGDAMRLNLPGESVVVVPSVTVDRVGARSGTM